MPTTFPKLPCMDAALSLLSRRGFAVKEMAGKLKDKGYPGREIADVINRLEEMAYLDDAAFAKARVRYRAEVSRWGRLRIVQELKEKGVSEAHIFAALDAWEAGADVGPFDDEERDWQARATALLAKKFGPWPATLPAPDPDLPDWEIRQEARKALEKEKNRRMNFLIRRGFTLQQARTALEAVGEG